MTGIEYPDRTDVDVTEAINPWSSLPEELSNPSFFISNTDHGVILDFFVSAVRSGNVDNLEKLLSSPLLSISPLTLPSLLARIWTTVSYSIRTRTTALTKFNQLLSIAEPTFDFQGFIPHLIASLSDSSPEVRDATATAVTALHPNYSSPANKRTVLGLTDLYPEVYIEGTELKWLAIPEAKWLIGDILLPKLPECRLDSGFVVRLIGGILNNAGKKGKKEQFFTCFTLLI
jgi:HEAT repeat